MASSNFFSATAKAALHKGHAIPMLVDYRHSAMPYHLLNVVGLIDTRTFEGAFVLDGSTDAELVSVELPEIQVLVSQIQSQCADAEAIHELWSRWNGGVRDSYFNFVQAIALRLSLAKLDLALETAKPVDSADLTGPKPQASAKPRAAKKRAAKKKQPRNSNK